MPLENAAAGSLGFSRNVEREMSAGKPQKQAVAIAYSKSRRRSDAEECSELKERMDALVGQASHMASRLDEMERCDARVRLDREAHHHTHSRNKLIARTTIPGGSAIQGKIKKAGHHDRPGQKFSE